MGPADRVELRKGLVLERLVLGDGLDDEVAVLEILEVDRAADTPERVRLGLLVHPGLGDQALEALAQTA